MKIPQPLSHAYLITGGCEASRAAFANRLAAAYLCEGEQAPCGSCRHCRKLAAGVHPDLTRVTIPEDKKEIVVDQARALRTDAYIRPNEGKRKVYVIDPADSMNESAQNALLKVLEEGPAYAAFLLLVSEPGKMLDTVRSRCEMLALPPEEEYVDPKQMARARELAELMLNGSELEIAESFTLLEQEKMKSIELMRLLALAETCVSEKLAVQPKRAVLLLKTLKTCRDHGVYNPGVGHTLGWILTQLFH